MIHDVRPVQYFHAVVEDAPGEAYEVLNDLAAAQVELLAFAAAPTGPGHAQLTLFPADPDRLLRAAEDLGFTLFGPQHAFLIQGDDRLGALAALHRKLYDAGINVYASTGVTDGTGGFGYLLYVRHDDFERTRGILGC